MIFAIIKQLYSDVASVWLEGKPAPTLAISE